MEFPILKMEFEFLRYEQGQIIYTYIFHIHIHIHLHIHSHKHKHKHYHIHIHIQSQKQLTNKFNSYPDRSPRCFINRRRDKSAQSYTQGRSNAHTIIMNK